MMMRAASEEQKRRQGRKAEEAVESRRGRERESSRQQSRTERALASSVARGRQADQRRTAVEALRDELRAAARRDRVLREPAEGPEEPTVTDEAPEVISPEDELVALGAHGPVSAPDAPHSLRLPAPLFDALLAQLEAAKADGLEHGGVFGATTEPGYLAVVRVDGDSNGIDYSTAQRDWAGLLPVGTFHAHVNSGQGAGPDGGTWIAGGHSDQDILELILGDHHASAVIAEQNDGAMRIFALLKPQTLTLIEDPEDFVADYRQRVLALVAGGADPLDASERELQRLSGSGILVLYTGDEPELPRR
jgi:hypothetical protein